LLLALCAYFDKGKKPVLAGWAIALSVINLLLVMALGPEA